jgi:hypothetical protein
VNPELDGRPEGCREEPDTVVKRGWESGDDGKAKGQEPRKRQTSNPR